MIISSWTSSLASRSVSQLALCLSNSSSIDHSRYPLGLSPPTFRPQIGTSPRPSRPQDPIPLPELFTLPAHNSTKAYDLVPFPKGNFPDRKVRTRSEANPREVFTASAPSGFSCPLTTYLGVVDCNRFG
ncbi:unnamed protein product [Somion occarium]|uniref:Uncharacterized protein n=1 Tax=Somion occarium TaxID=3059160 RepID=A0ABP1CPR8_9APHY